MKKMSGTLLVFILASVFVCAQKHERVNLQTDKIVYKGYTVRLLPAMGCTYGYDIAKDNQILLHQMLNPFTGSRMGLTLKEDAFKVAKWQIENMKQPAAVNRLPKTLKPSPALKLKLAQMEQRPIIPAATRKVADQLHIKLGNH